MNNTRKHNQGFSLVELLIAVAILSIVMIMVVQFMSTTSGAYKKNKMNLNIQTESMQIMEQMTDTIMQANYIRIQTKDEGMYTLMNTSKSTQPKREVSEFASYTAIDYDLVPDNYGNYSDDMSFSTNDKKVIIDFEDYQLYYEKKNKADPTSVKLLTFPLDTDEDNVGKVRSFRILKPGKKEEYRYVKPEYIYVEYIRKDDSGDDVVIHVLYHITGIVDKQDNTCAIYMLRYETNPKDTDKDSPTYSKNGFQYAKDTMKGYLTNGSVHGREKANASKFTGVIEGDEVVEKLKEAQEFGGLITNKVSDFYVSADSEGNAILLDVMFADGGYRYHSADTVICRNSDVLTLRPQKLFKLKEDDLKKKMKEEEEKAEAEKAKSESGDESTE